MLQFHCNFTTGLRDKNVKKIQPKNNQALTNAPQVRTSFFDAFDHGLLSLTYPHTGIVILVRKASPSAPNKTILRVVSSNLLFGLIRTFRVTDLSLQIVLVFIYEILDTKVLGINSGKKQKKRTLMPFK
jgi:hypothetical protein